jgi:AAHS family 4-hydroxybenzoate transporter-like MFS transporter
MANFFLASWLPLLLEMKGVNAHDAAIIFEFYHVGGTIGGVMMALLLDRFGMMTVAVLLALACPAVVAFGLPATPILLGFLIGFAGFSVIGGQFGNNAASGLIYPTYCRAKGVGMAFAAARFGSVLGPLVGAAMLGMHLPIMMLLLALAGPMLLGAVAACVLAFLTYRRFGGWQLSEVASAG